MGTYGRSFHCVCFLSEMGRKIKECGKKDIKCLVSEGEKCRTAGQL